MATKKIKSAIRSKAIGQMETTKQLAGVESLLQQSDFSSKMADLKAKEKETMFATAASGLELASTFGEGLKQKAELESNIKAFEESLPEAVRKAGGVSIVKNPDRASLMDVLKGEKGALTSFLTEEKDTYMLGENRLGSKYDVSAMGEKAKALKQTNLLDSFMEGEPLDSKSPTLESSLQLNSEGMPTLTKDFSPIYGKDTDIESLQDNINKPLIEKVDTKKDIIVDNKNPDELLSKGPLKLPEELNNKQNKLTYFSKELNHLNPDSIINEDSASAYEVATEKGSDKFVEDIPESEKSNLEKMGITKVIAKSNVKGFSDIKNKRWANPETALGEVDRSVKEIKKLEDKSRYSSKQSYKNALKRAEKLKKELKENISSIYNPKTGKFRSEEYKKLFEEGTGKRGGPIGSDQEKEGYANISAGVNLLGIELPGLRRSKEVDLTNIQNFMNELFPKDLASR